MMSVTTDTALRFRAYMRRDPGLFHVVLDDDNDQDKFAILTREDANTRGPEAIELADMLVAMSRTQRRKLAMLLCRGPK